RLRGIRDDADPRTVRDRSGPLAARRARGIGTAADHGEREHDDAEPHHTGASSRTACPLTVMPPASGMATVKRLGRPIASPCRIRTVAGTRISFASRRYPPSAAAAAPV